MGSSLFDASDERPPARAARVPFQLQVGDVIVENGAHAEVVGRPTNAANGKTTRAWLRREGETVQHEAVWEAWRKLRVIRRAAA